MIEEQACVIALDNDGVWVETQRRSSCGQCAANKSCGSALLDKVLGVKRSRVRTLNPKATRVSVGDEVVIGISEQALTRGSLAIYTLPLVMLFVFALLGETLAVQMSVANEDIFTAGLGVLGLLLGFLWVKRFSRVISDDPDYQPVLLRRVASVASVNIEL